MQRLRQLTFASLQCDRKTRQPHPLSVMLRVHCVQLFYNLSDPLMEDQLARRRASGALPG